MKVSVLFFGATADVAGTRKREVEIESGASSSSVFEGILESMPELRRHKLLFSVNQEFYSGSEEIKEGDELAIFTAVSGG